ncbi:MAG: acyl-CoA dehydrogenase family protein [Chloracidobacterium sp.]|nr:acyl-CoA dehydrogenase family protein [Chloracidobacterium sp.]
MAATQKTIFKGGGFLITETAPNLVFSPEDFTEEQRMIAKTTSEYIEKEVSPNSPRIEEKDYELQRQLLRKAGELGLLSASIPEQYGGLALDHISSMLISEYIAGQGSFATTFGATTSIGLLPIIYFGTDEQKKKYLPKIGSGEWVSAYCLSESGSGSDALAAKTTARLSAEGTHWILNGEKMWISNGGFADIYIVFAKVDGEKFTGFIIERNDSGVTPGAEEHKLGQRGSSTTPLLLQDCKIPKDRLLGEIGKGHLIAFNILNFGRFKLGAGCVGGSKNTLSLAAKYAAERRQFGQPIANFGAIKYKLAEMVARTYVCESAVYRTAGFIEDRESSIDKSDPKEVLAAIEEYAIECSILKVAGSETLAYCADEAVQIYGGNGFTSGYPVEAIYRDNRVNRIFEGTNEINRLLIPGMLLKRAMKGQLPLLAAAQKLQDELLTGPSFDVEEDDSPLAEERKLVANSKKVALAALGTAAQKYMQALEKEQMILTWIADIVIESYLMDSALGRTLKIIEREGAERHEAAIDATRLYVNDAMARVETASKNAVAATVEGDELRTLLAALRRFTKYTPVNASAIRTRLADRVVAAGGYIF